MTRQNGPHFDEEYLLQGQPTNSTYAESLPRRLVTSDLDPLTTQVCLATAIPVQYGDVISTLTWISGATDADTPTNQFAALYTAGGVLISQSADLEDAAWAANTAKTFTLASSYLVTTPGIVYASLMVKATDLPSLYGKTVGGAAVSTGVGSAAVVLAQTHGSSLTDTAPATIATPTVVANVPYVVAR